MSKAEKKPGEQDEEDVRNGWRYFAWALCPHIGKYGDDGEMQCRGADFKRGAEENLKQHVVSALREYREEIESRARREGAREALERAEKVLQWLATDPERRRMYVAYGARALACYVVDAVDAIRALADQPEAEGRQDSWTAMPHPFVKDEHNANTCGRCFRRELDPRHIEPSAPAKVDALPLGHEFVPSCYDESGDWCAALVPFDACGQPEAAHGRK